MRWLRSPGLKLCRVVYSWAGQLYTDLRTGCQWIKGISAGLTGFSGIKNAYRGREFFVAHERFLYAHESHELTRIFVSMNINGDLFGRTN